MPPVLEERKSSVTQLDSSHMPLSRREGNHLYRYSKVLDSHSVNEARARVMPTCPHLIWAQPHPLNISAPTDIYQLQKLLSLGDDDVDIMQPIVRRPDILPRGIRRSPDGVVHWDDERLVDDEIVESMFEDGDVPLLQSVAVLGTAVVVCVFGMRFYRRQNRQSRKHIHLTSATRRLRTSRTAR